MIRAAKWLLLAAAAIGLAAAASSMGVTAPRDLDAPRLIALGVIGLAILWSLWRAREPGRLRNGLIWMAILGVLAGGYQYRRELGDLAAIAPHYLVPGAPLTRESDAGKISVTLRKGIDGHFLARAEANGRPIAFMVDTGATTTVLSREDALSAGIALEGLAFTVPVSTANGEVYAARARLNTLNLGGIERRNMPVLVSGGPGLGQSLLGMNFLDTLGGYAVRGDRMVLDER